MGNRFRTDIYIQDIATGTVTQLTANRGDEADLDWSPDGTSIAFTSYEGIFTVAADGSGRVQVIAAEPGEFLDNPAWAPDGSKLLFTRFLDPNGDFEAEAAQIWSVDPDGANPVQLTPDDMFAQMPAWQPL
jgi:Tol biopolymer transport system component